MNEEPELGAARKAVYAAGDFTLSGSLAALSLIYTTYFLTQVAALRPVLAGLVPMIGRAIDAFADPLMGRLSDATTWRAGRRRPYLLAAAIPYGASFAALWIDAPFADAGARFAYYAVVYVVHALSMTVLTVPYLALIPEMATGYDARTSLNTFRTFGAMLGIFAAVGVRPVAEHLGGGKPGFAAAGELFGVLFAVPWLAVHRATFERAEFRARRAELGLLDGLRVVARHRTFTQLTGIYVMGRIAMDLAGALLILYVTFWMGRSHDFEPAMGIFLLAVVVALPFWLRFARGRDKARVFVVGSLWWAVTSTALLFAQPSWPRWVLFAYLPVIGVGYAVVDLMPWSMLGEVIDEDDLATGERREGLYNGVFTFLRKLGGALGVFLVLGLLDWLGFEPARTEQGETARQAIRWMTGLAPACFLAVGVWLARAYPLTRERHEEILRQLEARDRKTASAAAAPR